MGDQPETAREERRQAFVTMVTTDGFIPGAQVLLYSLRDIIKPADEGRSRPEVVVLVTKGVSAAKKALLSSLCNVVLEVEEIANPFATHVQGWVDSGFTKLRIWSLTQYDKVVYIDADCLVLDDITELFALETDFAAAPDVFPPDRFNAGVLVVRPDADMFAELLEKLPSLTSYDGGDTGYLNAFFPDWFVSSSSRRLPYRYNAQRTLHWMTHDKQPGYWDAVKPIKIVHYSSSPKPWEEGGRRKGELEMMWWEAFLRMQLGAASLLLPGGGQAS